MDKTTGTQSAGGLFALLSTTIKTVVAPVTQHSYTTLDSAKLLKMLRLKHKSRLRFTWFLKF